MIERLISEENIDKIFLYWNYIKGIFQTITYKWCFCHQQDLPSTGEEKYFQLHGRSSKSNVQGEIKLRLQLATREDQGLDEDDNWTDVRQHEDLICLFIEHEVRRLRVSYSMISINIWSIYDFKLLMNLAGNSYCILHDFV